MRARFSALLAAFLLTGCLLPQPDTPIIPPFGPAPQRAAAPADAPVPMAAPVSAPENGAAIAPGDTAVRLASARLRGRIEGEEVATVTAVPLEDEAVESAFPVEDGAFDASLSEGSYHLDLALKAGGTRRVDQVITLVAGEDRDVVITVASDAATVSEAVAEEPVASPAM